MKIKEAVGSFEFRDNDGRTGVWSGSFSVLGRATERQILKELIKRVEEREGVCLTPIRGTFTYSFL